MPADYLSRLPSTKQDHLAEITTCFDPFQPELLDLQKADPDLQKMNHFRLKGEWPAEVTKADANYLQNLAVNLFQDAYKIVWIQLDDYQYPRTAHFLPEKFQNWLSVRHTITNLGAIHLLSKRIYALQPPTTGQEYTQTEPRFKTQAAAFQCITEH